MTLGASFTLGISFLRASSDSASPMSHDALLAGLTICVGGMLLGASVLLWKRHWNIGCITAAAGILASIILDGL